MTSEGKRGGLRNGAETTVEGPAAECPGPESTVVAVEMAEDKMRS